MTGSSPIIAAADRSVGRTDAPLCSIDAFEPKEAVVGPLLQAKLYAPRPRRGVVARPRLVERLDRGAESKLTLVSAPAGFGKSTLLAEWLAARAGTRASAWLSLDAADNEPAVFWSYLVAALQAVVPVVDGAPLVELQVPESSTLDAGLSALLNALGALPHDVVLVLDDYHAIDSPEIAVGVASLLEHLPHQVHLVLTTRADPALPLARLRGRGELVEIRAADLRFTSDEAAAYLNGPMGLGLAAPDVAALEGRTEGWIAALQLAALSLQGRDDPTAFIAGFAGDDRYVVDYLVEEVLGRQPEAVRTFLLETSVLGRLTGPLCDAVTTQDGSKAMLEALERGNLFLVPLDDRRQWYRYHHLFADVLRAHLQEERPELMPLLHLRAAAWFEAHGERSEAIRHAIAGEDFAQAADLVEIAAHDLRAYRQEGTLRRWLDAFPDETFDTRPVLAIVHAGAMLASGELGAADAHRAAARLAAAERWVPAARDERERVAAVEAGMIVRHPDALGHLPNAIAIYRAALARMGGDVAGTIAHARSVLASAGPDQPLERGSAAGFLGLAAWTNGDLEEAHGWWSEAVANLERAGHISDVLGCSIALADIRITQGRLTDALRTYERGLQLATGPGAAPLRGVADMHVGMADLFRERNDLAAARQQLRASDELGEQGALAQNAYRSRVVTARLLEAEGDLQGALAALGQAAQRYAGDYFPDVRPIPAMQSRTWIGLGNLDAAAGWARERGLAAGDDLGYPREFEHITLARLLLAQGRPEVAELLERLCDAAEAEGRTGSLIEILVLQALAVHRRGDMRAALAPLERALALAEPEGYVRLFLDAGRPMDILLEAAARQGIAPRSVARLLAASRGAPAAPSPGRLGLVEPLSERELDVLRLLATDLDGPEIAAELVVSLNTVRSHTRSIYSKLDVNNRRAAIRRADELGLLARSTDRRPRT